MEQIKFQAIYAENKRLRKALQQIIDEAESDDGLSAWVVQVDSALHYRKTLYDRHA